MSQEREASTSVLLQRYRAGDLTAQARLYEHLYDELHRLALHYMRGEKSGHVLQPTALINEAYIRLMDQREKDFQNRSHFVGFAATVMRQVLVDFARAANTAKRNFGRNPEPLDESLPVASPAPTDALVLEADLLKLDAALIRLERLDERQARVVELRYFAGLSIEATAALLEVSERTVKRDWTQARAWLYGELKSSPEIPPGTR